MELTQQEFEDRMVDVPGVEGPVFGWLLVDLRFEVWHQACFVPTDMVRNAGGTHKPLTPGYGLQVGESIIKGWNDHEHCAVCWFTFLGIEHQYPAVPGWTDDRGAYWLCDRCHAALTAWWEQNPFPAHWRPFSG